jgi:hypothetical protein
MEWWGQRIDDWNIVRLITADQCTVEPGGARRNKKANPAVGIFISICN